MADRPKIRKEQLTLERPRKNIDVGHNWLEEQRKEEETSLRYEKV